MTSSDKSHQGECYCGAVKLVVTGDAAGAGYCHCKACRSWSAGPSTRSLSGPRRGEIIQGEELIGEYHGHERSYRQWCTQSWAPAHAAPALGLVDVYAATSPSFPFEPGVHVNYESTVLPMKDGLPKLKDFPIELGGSGETLAE